MSPYQYKSLIVVPAASRDLVRTALCELGGDYKDSITLPMSVNGQEPATHYAACWSVCLPEVSTIDSVCGTVGVTGWLWPLSHGSQTKLNDCQNVNFGSVTIDDAADLLGLKVIRSEGLGA